MAIEQSARSWGRLQYSGGVAAVPGVGKVCHRCGRDLTRQVRYRDENGYWCAPCSKAEKKAYRANHLPCDDCGQDVQRGQEVVLEGVRLCPVCHQKRQVQDLRQRMAAEAQAQRKEQKRQRWRTVRNWSLVAAELLVAGVLMRFMLLSGPESMARPAAPATLPTLVASGEAPSSPAAAP